MLHGRISNIQTSWVKLGVERTQVMLTGGANDPIYGCPPCIPRAVELPPGRWRLVKEFPAPDPVTEWRFEPVRVWEAIPSPATPPPAPPSSP